MDSVQNYNTAMEEHTKDDEVILKVIETERHMNQHLGHFNRMFRVGATHGHEERIAGASTSSNVPPPAKYGLRKDHKTVPPGREKYGPKVRGVCGAKEAPNSKLSHFLSMMINHYADSAEHENEFMSSEEMRAAFQEFNELSAEMRQNCRIISMDVKALYPSMRWKEIICAVKEMIMLSSMIVENVDWHEVGKYIAVHVPDNEIETEGLSLVLPKRKGLRLRRITVNYLRNKKNNVEWTIARRPGNRQKRKMLALAVSVGVQTVMSGHTYMVGDTYYLQAEGGTIGLELTGAVSRPFMQRWDRQYLDMVRKAGITMPLYKRYIDDSNQMARVPPAGSRFEGTIGRLVCVCTRTRRRG